MSDIYWEFQKQQDTLLNTYVEKYFSPKLYNDIMDKLKELKAYGEKNSYWYGDADVFVHIDTISGNECLVTNNVVTCGPLPVCIISMEENIDDLPGSKIQYSPYSITAVCTTMKSVKAYDNQWNDRRDYKNVGLDILKEKGFKFLYKDTRDKEWAFNSEYFLNETQQFKNLNRDNTLFVLSELSYLHSNLNNLSK
jgi:hypothetical protein